MTNIQNRQLVLIMKNISIKLEKKKIYQSLQMLKQDIYEKLEVF